MVLQYDFKGYIDLYVYKVEFLFHNWTPILMCKDMYRYMRIDSFEGDLYLETETRADIF